MRFHLIGLAHTQTTKDYSNCAFTELARKMANMMYERHHDVFLYGGESHDAKVTEFIPCITKRDQKLFCDVGGPETILNAKDWSPTAPHWAFFNMKAIAELKARIKPDDIILLSSGWSLSPIIEAFPNITKCEYAAGYTGIHDKAAHIFPSHAWMNAVYGKWYGCHGTRGRFWDGVIPHYFDVSEFPVADSKKHQICFIGRLNEDKGIGIALDVAKTLDVPLVVGGQGTYRLPDWVDYRGLVGAEERAKILGESRACLCPSLYLEPFGKIAIESMLCGTPAITTDWGAFPETVDRQWRCNSFSDFMDATRQAISGIYHLQNLIDNTKAKFSIENIGPMYENYFHHLPKRIRDGWYAGSKV